MDFDFDTWSKLARENPAEFERRRESMLRQSIESAPAEHRRRLEGLQFQIDLERRRSGSTLGACLKLNTMMWERFHALREELIGLLAGGERAPVVKPAAHVIPIERFAREKQAATPAEN